MTALHVEAPPLALRANQDREFSQTPDRAILRELSYFIIGISTRVAELFQS